MAKFDFWIVSEGIGPTNHLPLAMIVYDENGNSFYSEFTEFNDLQKKDPEIVKEFIKYLEFPEKEKYEYFYEQHDQYMDNTVVRYEIKDFSDVVIDKFINWVKERGEIEAVHAYNWVVDNVTNLVLHYPAFQRLVTELESFRFTIKDGAS